MKILGKVMLTLFEFTCISFEVSDNGCLIIPGKCWSPKWTTSSKSLQKEQSYYRTLRNIRLQDKSSRVMEVKCCSLAFSFKKIADHGTSFALEEQLPILCTWLGPKPWEKLSAMKQQHKDDMKHLREAMKETDTQNHWWFTLLSA